MSSKKQARKGGQVGVNGSFYVGGQYLPNSAETIKGQQKQTKPSNTPRNQEIANYKWEVSEKESIWKKCGIGVYTNFAKTGYSKETGSQGSLSLNPNYNWGWNVGEETEAVKKHKAEIVKLIERWNAGERWV